tara:strand:- start:525 stop:698 length:174 start_codon:yes stop_codon:yes gene_type:complete
LYPNILTTENTINIDGITKLKPHNDTINLTNLICLCRFKESAKGIANKQLINADKKA